MHGKVLFCHSMIFITDKTTNPTAENTSKPGSMNFQLTIKSSGLCKNISSGINKSTINDIEKDSDNIAASLHFGGMICLKLLSIA